MKTSGGPHLHDSNHPVFEEKEIDFSSTYTEIPSHWRVSMESQVQRSDTFTDTTGAMSTCLVFVGSSHGHSGGPEDNIGQNRERFLAMEKNKEVYSGRGGILPDR